MTLEITQKKSEWIVSKGLRVSVCVGVCDGAINEIRLNGLVEGTNSIHLDPYRIGILTELHDALEDAIAAIGPAIDRTAMEVDGESQPD